MDGKRANIFLLAACVLLMSFAPSCVLRSQVDIVPERMSPSFSIELQNGKPITMYLFNMPNGIYHGYDATQTLPFLWAAKYEGQHVLELRNMTGALLPGRPVTLVIVETSGAY